MNDASGKKGRIYKNLLRDEVVKSLFLTRYAVKNGKPDPTKPVLTTGRDMAFIYPGVSNWKLEMSKPAGMIPSKVKPPLVEVNASWFSSQQAMEKGIKVVHGSSANVFGFMGALLVPDGFTIPTVTATKANVRHYGLELIEDGEDFSVTSAKYPIALMQYTYTKDYKKDFLMQKHGGGGAFVETHDFPHIYIPLSKECGGHIVIGKRLTEDRFHFTAFQIPAKHALHIPSNIIHGDGTLIGNYALGLASAGIASSETVLIYNRHSLEMAHGVVPDTAPRHAENHEYPFSPTQIQLTRSVR